VAVPGARMNCHQCHQYVTSNVTSTKCLVLWVVMSVTTYYARAHVRGGNPDYGFWVNIQNYW
jgi:hypothetical protein